MAGQSSKTLALDAHPAVLVGIAGAVKSAAVTKAKGKICDRSIQPVDVTCRIRGQVSKGSPTPPAHGDGPATVNFEALNVFAEVLKRLKVEPATLKRAMRPMLKQINEPSDVQQLGQDEQSTELRRVVEQLAGETSAKLPPQPWSSPGRAAPVRFDLDNLQILEASPCSPPPAAA